MPTIDLIESVEAGQIRHHVRAHALRAREMDCRAAGMTLIEILIAVAIVGLLSMIAIPTYGNYMMRAYIAQAKSDIMDIGVGIAQYQADHVGELPDDLTAIGKGSLLDPWGNPYQYLNLSSLTGNGKARKNKSLTPINSDYDLYSLGADGDSKGPLTAKASQDDIVRANNGRFIGLVSEY